MLGNKAAVLNLLSLVAAVVIVCLIVYAARG
jgi:hypothetical protein